LSYRRAVTDPLTAFLAHIPAIHGTISSGRFDSGNWWVTFQIDITHPLAWRVVQELGHVLELRVGERTAADGVHAGIAAAIPQRRRRVPVVGDRVT
jgi:hypothetical protein